MIFGLLVGILLYCNPIKNMIVQLTRRQRKIVKKIAKLQITSLEAILHGDCEDDLPMFCIERGIPMDKFLLLTKKNISDFRELINNPELFMTLPERHMVAFKQLLNTQIPPSEAKREIWAKLIIAEYYPINPN